MNNTQELNNLTTTPNIGRRYVAGLVDYSIILTFYIVYLYSFGEPSDSGYSISGYTTLVPVIFWAIITVGIEQMMGATLGNLMMSLKPVSVHQVSIYNPDTLKLTFIQSLKRHLLDPIDMTLFGIIGIIVITNTPKHQRIGDIWAHTIVVKDLD
jgi:uncharacterized RDD family membrane protein YckC